MIGKLFVQLITGISLQTKTHACVLSSQTTSSTPRKAAKRGTKLKSSSPSNFCRICASSFAICQEYILKVSDGVALVNYNVCDTMFSRESSFYNMFWNFTSKKVLCCLLKTSLYFALPISRSMPFFVDKAMEEILSFFTCSSCFSICTFAFLLLLCRVDTSDFPQSKVTKLQRLSTQEDEQQPLSVHL